jgi:hypothetical protein
VGGSESMNRLQIQIVKDAMDMDHLLTEWEFNFINDLAERGDDYELSEKQNQILNRIGSKVS